jgi:quinol monooxygenase YgiN
MALVLIARWVAREGEEEKVEAALRKLTEPSRAEPGCLAYQPCRERDDPRRFLVFEVYRDDEALAAHGASEHFQRHGLGEGIPLLESRERTLYETIEP